MIRRVHQPRWPITALTTDPPSATFHPKTVNQWRCRLSPLFMRKWRGNRSRFWIAHLATPTTPTKVDQ